MFETYGDVTPQELCHLTAQVESMTFPPNEPIDTIFTEIDDLGTIAELARVPMTEQQKINMGYLLIQQTQVYSTSLNKWNQKDFDDQTWDLFKSHFREAQKALRRTGALTVQESLNHTELVNLVQQGVQQALATSPSPTSDLSAATPPSNYVPALEAITDTPSTFSVNSTTSDLTMQTIQQQMDMMKQMMEMLQATNSNSNRSSRRNPNLTKYCWTHGLCSHSSAECRTKADGHKNAATLQNCLGGSNKNITHFFGGHPLTFLFLIFLPKYLYQYINIRILVGPGIYLVTYSRMLVKADTYLYR